MEIKDLDITGIIGFDGLVKHGLQVHPDGKHLVYAMGNKVTVKNIESGKQDFLSGHTNVVTSLCISPCGKFIASGQMTELLLKAMVIVWNFEDRTMKGSYEIHKAKVQDLCFTCKSRYLVSLGGKDDCNIIIWDVDKSATVTGAFASTEITGDAMTIARVNTRDDCFLTGGDCTLRIWSVNPEARKVHGVNVKVSKLRRCINCIVVDDKDAEAYCGTTTGDIIRIRLNFDTDPGNSEPGLQPPVMMGCYSKIPDRARKSTGGELYPGGVMNLQLIGDKRLLVATGNGTIELVEIINSSVTKQPIKLPSTPQIRTLKTTSVRGAVTSAVPLEGKMMIGTAQSEIYRVNLTNLDTQLTLSCHTHAVYDVAFPPNFSEIFATGSKNDIRLWHLQTRKELLRITVPNFVCTSLCFTYDGKLILSAWNDGVVRALRPQSGSLFFAIYNAHLKAVSAIGVTKDGKTLVTGGCDGQVRVWTISKDIQRLETLLKEHRGPVTSLQLSSNDEEVVSSSTDGTCVIWDLVELVRKQVIMGNVMFMCARFSPNGIQILTCGTDRNVAYWETLDGSIIREIEASKTGTVNCLDISSDGRYFVTGGNDCLLKFWEYMSGDVTHVGRGHAAIITACKFSPDGSAIVSTSSDGAVIIWKNPIQLDLVLDSAKSDRTSQKRSSSRRSEEVEENVIHTASIKNDNDKYSPVTVHHESDQQHNLCDYDPLVPVKDSCRSDGGAKKLSTDPELDRRSIRSDGYLEVRKKSAIPLRISVDSGKKLSDVSNVRRISGKINIHLTSSAHK